MRLSVCRHCRREGIKLFLKGDRCFTDKCAISRRTYAPGQHGQRRKKPSEYGLQLREKQKVKRIYGLRERQFRKIFGEAERSKGITGEMLLVLLERRLDNIVWRMGFARSLKEARKWVKHGHFLVNGKVVTLPSYTVQKEDKIAVHEKTRTINGIIETEEGAPRRGIPAWLKLEKEKMEGLVADFPGREQLTMPIEEQLIVELYSK
ncbi:MAG: 30S ribosomal protein S4 [Deltaproteobacteria bacterium]|nr:30S ribosomal protein S4 [Deltaproteobacteria bacterium]